MVALMLVIFASRTWLRNMDWIDEPNLYKTGLEVLPYNAKLHHNYATSINDYELKEHHLRAAMRIYPPYGG